MPKSADRTPSKHQGVSQFGYGPNYAQFNSAGEYNAYGSALTKRYKWMPPLGWDATAGSVGPSQSNSKWPSQFFDKQTLGASANIAIYFVQPAPEDAATGCNSDFEVWLATRLANTANASGAWILAWDIITDGSSTGTTGSGVITASYNEGQYAFQKFAASSADHIASTNRMWAFTLTLTGSNHPGGSSVDFLGLRWNYHSDKLGA